jgi:sirohydrochlorin ferrochelatase
MWDMKTALLLIAHGSREEAANADLHQMAAELRRRGEYAEVEAAFLELAEPNIDQAAATCVVKGAEQIVMLPYFLSAGVHVRRDLTANRDRLAQRHPQAAFILAEPLGRHPLLIDVVVDRARQAERAAAGETRRCH